MEKNIEKSMGEDYRGEHGRILHGRVKENIRRKSGGGDYKEEWRGRLQGEVEKKKAMSVI